LEKEKLLQETPFANLPFLRDSKLSFLLTESKAILQHLGRELGYYGSNAEERAKIDNVIYFVEDIRSACTGICYNPAFKDKKALVEPRVSGGVANLDKWISQQKTEFIASKELSIADLFVYEVLDMIFHLFPQNKETAVHCVKFHNKVHTLEKVKAYRESDRFHTNYNNKSSYWGGGARPE
jgi:glutathione S-transferase